MKHLLFHKRRWHCFLVTLLLCFQACQLPPQVKSPSPSQKSSAENSETLPIADDVRAQFAALGFREIEVSLIRNPPNASIDIPPSFSTMQSRNEFITFPLSNNVPRRRSEPIPEHEDWLNKTTLSSSDWNKNAGKRSIDLVHGYSGLAGSDHHVMNLYVSSAYINSYYAVPANTPLNCNPVMTIALEGKPLLSFKPSFSKQRATNLGEHMEGKDIYSPNNPLIIIRWRAHPRYPYSPPEYNWIPTFPYFTVTNRPTNASPFKIETHMSPTYCDGNLDPNHLSYARSHQVNYQIFSNAFESYGADGFEKTPAYMMCPQELLFAAQHLYAEAYYLYTQLQPFEVQGSEFLPEAFHINRAAYNKHKFPTIFRKPSFRIASDPSSNPSADPSSSSSSEPSNSPTSDPSENPSAEPSEEPSSEPTSEPSEEPIPEPFPEPTPDEPYAPDTDGQPFEPYGWHEPYFDFSDPGLGLSDAQGKVDLHNFSFLREIAFLQVFRTIDTRLPEIEREIQTLHTEEDQSIKEELQHKIQTLKTLKTRFISLQNRTLTLLDNLEPKPNTGKRSLCVKMQSSTALNNYAPAALSIPYASLEPSGDLYVHVHAVNLEQHISFDPNSIQLDFQGDIEPLAPPEYTELWQSPAYVNSAPSVIGVYRLPAGTWRFTEAYNKRLNEYFSQPLNTKDDFKMLQVKLSACPNCFQTQSVIPDTAPKRVSITTPNTDELGEEGRLLVILQMEIDKAIEQGQFEYAKTLLDGMVSFGEWMNENSSLHSTIGAALGQNASQILEQIKSLQSAYAQAMITGQYNQAATIYKSILDLRTTLTNLNPVLKYGINPLSQSTVAPAYEYIGSLLGKTAGDMRNMVARMISMEQYATIGSSNTEIKSMNDFYYHTRCQDNQQCALQDTYEGIKIEAILKLDTQNNPVGVQIIIQDEATPGPITFVENLKTWDAYETLWLLEHRPVQLSQINRYANLSTEQISALGLMFVNRGHYLVEDIKNPSQSVRHSVFAKMNLAITPDSNNDYIYSNLDNLCNDTKNRLKNQSSSSTENILGALLESLVKIHTLELFYREYFIKEEKTNLITSSVYKKTYDYTWVTNSKATEYIQGLRFNPDEAEIDNLLFRVVPDENNLTESGILLRGIIESKYKPSLFGTQVSNGIPVRISAIPEQINHKTAQLFQMHSKNKKISISGISQIKNKNLISAPVFKVFSGDDFPSHITNQNILSNGHNFLKRKMGATGPDSSKGRLNRKQMINTINMFGILPVRIPESDSDFNALLNGILDPNNNCIP